MNEYSEQALAHILNRKPEWFEYVAVENNDIQNYFELEIPSPMPGTDGLIISSVGDVLTLFWKEFHMHFDSNDTAEGSSERDVTDLFEVLEPIFTEELVLVNNYRRTLNSDRRWSGSSLAPVENQRGPEPGMVWEVTSWQGTHNRTVDLSEGAP